MTPVPTSPAAEATQPCQLSPLPRPVAAPSPRCRRPPSRAATLCSPPNPPWHGGDPPLLPPWRGDDTPGSLQGTAAALPGSPQGTAATLPGSRTVAPLLPRRCGRRREGRRRENRRRDVMLMVWRRRRPGSRGCGEFARSLVSQTNQEPNLSVPHF
ncbi:hypothetical protein PVAP13_2NG122003 [Panicum virgatum]|uniref:Uncharacterized protein n=1 Tax=Panicum virgatum TaxID=38727 RepID=A0A8T0VH02_PANVG|nr:hypothetical protein PVAP13_2NG122003 [Panicum virgatum]